MPLDFLHHAPEPSAPVAERGPWVATSLGGMWSLQHPHPRDVTLPDIVAGLSRTCRYGGQLRRGVLFYSVAEHSLLLTDWAIDNGLVRHREDALLILMHDASEAYLGDVPSPLKALLPDFRAMEGLAQLAVLDSFGLTPDRLSLDPRKLKELDTRIRLDERAELILEPASSEGRKIIWKDLAGATPLGVAIRGLAPDQAAETFRDGIFRICEALPLRDPELEECHAAHLALLRETFLEDAPAP